MKRNGTLLNKKYRSLLVATLAMTASTYLSSILDGIREPCSYTPST